MRINRIGYLFKEGIKSIFTHGFMSFASVTIITACLIICGCFSLLSLNIDSIITKLESENEILCFVDDEVSDSEALDIKARIESIPNVADAVFVDRDEAMENFINQFDDESMFSDVDSSVFRHRYVVYLSDLSLMSSTASDLEGVRGIAKVNAPTKISQGFIAVRNVVSAVSLVLIAILLIVSVFIMANTIKLATYGRKEEIAIMKMVGAGNGFIRCPFIIEGIILGVLGGAIAFAILFGLYSLVAGRIMASSVAMYISLVPFADFQMPLLCVFLGVGVVVGMFGSNIAIRNYLNV